MITIINIAVGQNSPFIGILPNFIKLFLMFKFSGTELQKLLGYRDQYEVWRK